MLNNETRNLLVNAYQKHGDADVVASMFAVTPRTVYHSVAQKRDTDSVELRTPQTWKKA